MLDHVRTPAVTPRAGVWIETAFQNAEYIWCDVTPRAGVWIETFRAILSSRTSGVTPRAGVWIETIVPVAKDASMASLLVQECGLKRHTTQKPGTPRLVTPRAGVWIETSSQTLDLIHLARHSSCRSVD